MSRSSTRSWIFWIPVVFVGAVIYWSLALGSAGLSLFAVGALPEDDADESEAPQAEGLLPGEEQIPVALQEEPADPRAPWGPTAVEPMPPDALRR